MAELQKLTGLDKTAILFNTLGSRLAAKLFSGLKESQLLKIQQHTQHVKNVSFKVKKQVLEEFYFGFMAEKMKPSSDEKKNQPFEFLSALTEVQIAYLIQGEAPRSMAIIIAQLPKELQTGLLNRQTIEDRTEILLEMGYIREIPLEAIVTFAGEMKDKASQIPSQSEYSEGGGAAVADVLSTMDSKEQKQFLEFLAQESPELAKEVKKYHFSFDNIPSLPDQILRDIFNNLDLDDIALALKGQDEEFETRVIDNLPKKKQAMFERREGPVPRKQVELAQKRVLDQINSFDKDPNNSFSLADFMESDYID
jgi:flagellar motor switch protein FliG